MLQKISKTQTIIIPLVNMKQLLPSWMQRLGSDECVIAKRDAKIISNLMIDLLDTKFYCLETLESSI